MFGRAFSELAKIDEKVIRAIERIGEKEPKKFILFKEGYSDPPLNYQPTREDVHLILQAVFDQFGLLCQFKEVVSTDNKVGWQLIIGPSDKTDFRTFSDNLENASKFISAPPLRENSPLSRTTWAHDGLLYSSDTHALNFKRALSEGLTGCSFKAFELRNTVWRNSVRD